MGLECQRVKLNGHTKCKDALKRFAFQKIQPLGPPRLIRTRACGKGRLALFLARGLPAGSYSSKDAFGPKSDYLK